MPARVYEQLQVSLPIPPNPIVMMHAALARVAKEGKKGGGDDKPEDDELKDELGAVDVVERRTPGTSRSASAAPGRAMVSADDKKEGKRHRKRDDNKDNANDDSETARAMTHSIRWYMGQYLLDEGEYTDGRFPARIRNG